MSKKDYILLAAALRESEPTYDEARPSWVATCNNVANALGRQRAQFDRARFLAACGV
jgi:hypothetical protein